MNEADIQARTMLRLGRMPDIRIFRNNVGLGWAGKLVHQEGDMVTLAGARPVRFGLAVGSHDLIGLRRVVVLPQDVGRHIGQFVSLDVKRRHGVHRDAQERWAAMVLSFGGVTGFPESPDEAQDLVCS